MSDNPYSILSIQPSSNLEDIRKAFRKISLQTHPDKESADLDKFVAAAAAYRTLSDAKLRAEYESNTQYFQAPTAKNGMPSALKTFADFFGTDNPFSAVASAASSAAVIACGPAPAPPSIVREKLAVSLGLLYAGGATRKRVPIVVKGPDGINVEEERVVDVNIARGTAEGATVRFSQRKGDVTGDIILTVESEPHPTLTRNGDDLETTINVPLRSALTGVLSEVDMPDGRKLNISIDRVIPSGYVHTVKGAGMPALDGSRGNLHVTCNVVFPSELNELQRELLGFALAMPKNLRQEQSDALRLGLHMPSKLSNTEKTLIGEATSLLIKRRADEAE